MGDSVCGLSQTTSVWIEFSWLFGSRQVRRSPIPTAKVDITDGLSKIPYDCRRKLLMKLDLVWSLHSGLGIFKTKHKQTAVFTIGAFQILASVARPRHALTLRCS
jgi:hypothetical protein